MRVCGVTQKGRSILYPALGGHRTLGEFAPFTYGKGASQRQARPGRAQFLSSVPTALWAALCGVDPKGQTVIHWPQGDGGSGSLLPWSVVGQLIRLSLSPETTPELLRFKYYALGALGLSDMNNDSAVPGTQPGRFPRERDTGSTPSPNNAPSPTSWARWTTRSNGTGA